MRPGDRSPAAVFLLTIAATALATSGFLNLAPNRLVSGTPLGLLQVTTPPVMLELGTAGGFMLLAALLPQTRWARAMAAASAVALLLLLFYAAASGAQFLAASASPIARIGLGPAFWIGIACASLLLIDALRRLDAGPLAQFGVLVLLGLLFTAAFQGGLFDALSILHEYANHRDAFRGELLRHCALVLGAVIPALLIGVPLGILAARRPAARGPVFAVLNLLQTVPSIALFGLLIAPLVALGLPGVGFLPAVIALTLYALLPVVRNTNAGITGADPAVIDAALGMGLTAAQIFWRVELPLGLPVFLAGLRIVIVQAIGLAVVAALIGAGGLGAFVFQGIGQYAIDLVLLGAVPTILLALAANFILGILITLSRKGSKS